MNVYDYPHQTFAQIIVSDALTLSTIEQAGVAASILHALPRDMRTVVLVGSIEDDAFYTLGAIAGSLSSEDRTKAAELLAPSSSTNANRERGNSLSPLPRVSLTRRGASSFFTARYPAILTGLGFCLTLVASSLALWGLYEGIGLLGRGLGAWR